MKKISFIQKILFLPILIYDFIDIFVILFKLRKFKVTKESDKNAVQDIDEIIVNSENVKKRVFAFAFATTQMRTQMHTG